MAQGKMKVKSKLPDSAKGKAKGKGKPATQRSNKPIKPKKQKFQEAQKLKKAVTRSLNKKVEEEIRERAMGPKKTLSKAQEAVAAHHKAAGSSKT